MRLLVAALLAIAACAPAPIKVGPIATRAPLVDTATFLATIERSGKITYKVAYDVVGAGAGGTVRGRWTIYQRPPDVRVDTISTVGGATQELRTWAVGTMVHVCASPTDCRSAERDAAETIGAGSQLDAQVRARPHEYEVSKGEDQTVVGRTAFCFHVVPKTGVRAEFTEADLCYGADGVPLVVRLAASDQEVSFRAVSVSDQVTDEEMRPPR